jgi:hypothetical protein
LEVFGLLSKIHQTRRFMSDRAPQFRKIHHGTAAVAGWSVHCILRTRDRALTTVVLCLISTPTSIRWVGAVCPVVFERARLSYFQS